MLKSRLFVCLIVSMHIMSSTVQISNIMPIIEGQAGSKLQPTFSVDTGKRKSSESDRRMQEIDSERKEKRREENLLKITKLENRLMNIKVFRGLEKVKKLLEDKESKRRAQEEKVRREILGIRPNKVRGTTMTYRSILLLIRN